MEVISVSEKSSTSCVIENVSLTALWLGFGFGFGGVLGVMIMWDKARHWMMVSHKTQPTT